MNDGKDGKYKTKGVLPAKSFNISARSNCIDYHRLEHTDTVCKKGVSSLSAIMGRRADSCRASPAKTCDNKGGNEMLTNKGKSMLPVMKKGLMIIFVITIISIALPFQVFAASEAVTMENPKHCRQCGMDQTAFVQSRMLVVYSDLTTVEVCSIHCAALELKQNKGRQVKSLMVAHYMTKEMIDARTAAWVVGGNKPGGMNSPAKWAFAKEVGAQNFVTENGGKVTSFDEAMKSANEEVSGDVSVTHDHHSHAGHMGPGAQMLFNPAFGDDIYHTHPAGMWMAPQMFQLTRLSP